MPSNGLKQYFLHTSRTCWP